MNTPRKPRVFISRTTAGLKVLAEEIAEILRQRGAEPVVQSHFLPDWRSVPQMLQDKLIACDSVIALIGPVHGGEPDREPARLKDPRTHGRTFSFTQWEFLVARDLGRPMFTFVVSGDDMVAPFEKENAALEQRQQQFIADFPKDLSTLFYEYTDRAKLLDHIREMELPLTAFAGKPANIPYASLGTLFKGRDEFLTELRTHLTAEATTVIKGHRTIHGMGGVGKTRAAIEYAWKHADDYNALLFVAADSPSDLYRNIAALCGPLVLNLPEQDEKDQNLQVEAALRWLELHPGWFLIIDNVDTEDAAVETRALLERLSKGHVVITSRISDWTGQVKALDLDVLSEAASIEFLDERTAERRIEQDGDLDNVKKLVQLLDCLALALEQAGAHISQQRISYADYIALWESKRPVALAWHDEATMKYPRSLAITYETSVAQLSSGAKELFSILSWFAPDPIPRRLTDSRPHPDDERRHLGEIERLHLARFLSDGKSFNLHRLNQEITRQQQSEPQPLPLITALEWVNVEMPLKTQDVRTWPIALPLTPHAIAAATFGAAHDIPEPTVRLLVCAALLLKTRADHRSAEPLYRQALALAEQVRGKDAPIVATCLNNLAQLLQATNRLAEAEPLMRRALAIDEASFGSDHSEVATDLNNLASLLQVTHRLAEAEPLMRRALTIWEVSLGSDHPNVAHSLNNLSQLLQATNRLAEAEPLMRRALAIFERSLGSDHPNVATQLNNLGGLMHALNRLAEAEPLMRRALDIDEASLGSDHPNVATGLNNFAQFLKASNRLAEAESLMRRALDIFERSLGSNHPNVATQLNNLAGLLRATNRLVEAEPLIRRALAIAEANFGSDHPVVATRRNNLAQLLKATNRLAEAEPLMRQMMEIALKFTRDTGDQHPHLMDAINSYGGLLMQMGDTRAQAEEKIDALLTAYGLSFG